MRSVFLLIVLLQCLNAKAQKVDYLEMRDTLTYLSCVKVSPDTIDLSLKNLQSLDVNSIDTNLSHYYYDLGWAYFFKSAYTKDQSWKDLSDLAYFKCYSLDSNYVSALWNLASHYSGSGECKLSNVLLDEYEKRCPKEYFKAEDVKMVRERCKTK